MAKRSVCLIFLSVAVSVAACQSSPGPADTTSSNDTVVDTANDTVVDTANDTAVDTANDTGVDTANDTGARRSSSPTSGWPTRSSA
ncbi:MAG: hypothetical protein IV100_28635 [Myxococcales bacterium]|nr:hypothetical protein [Myxococcales bacterium]